jgi:feruloyl esterase
MLMMFLRNMVLVAALLPGAAVALTGDSVCSVDGTGILSNGVTFIDFTLRPETESAIRCRIELPSAAKWNGELWGVGTSSMGGSVRRIGEYSAAGCAVATTDLGTSRYVAGGDRAGEPLPEAVFKDYSWRATHLMTVYAKRFVGEHYGTPPRRSYFRGGSCGGRQGLSEAMRFPADYDGVIAAIPAAMAIVANAQALNVYRQTHDASGQELFTPKQLRLLADAPIEYMQNRDVPPYAGSVLSNPFLTEEEIDGILSLVARKDPTLADAEYQKRMRGIFQGVQDAAGRTICHGMLPGVFHGEAKGMSMKAKGLCLQSVLRDGAAYPAYPSWDDFERLAVSRGGEINAASTDLSEFARRGGKLIVTCGWEDQTTPAPEVVSWYEYLVAAQGGLEKTQAFCRLFPLPGVAHGGGHGRITVGGAACTGVHLDLLRRWVEDGEAPTVYPLLWRQKKLTLPIPPYPLQCYLDDNNRWQTRRYPTERVRHPHPRYFRTDKLR